MNCPPSTAGGANLQSSRGKTEKNHSKTAMAIKVGETITIEGHRALDFILDTDVG